MSYGYSNGNDMVMPVAPMGYGNGGNGNGGFGWGGDGAWWFCSSSLQMAMVSVGAEMA